MKVKIKKWNAVATWRWDIPEDDVCGICQVDFDGTCPSCKYPGDDCSLCKSMLPKRDLVGPGNPTLLTYHSIREVRSQLSYGLSSLLTVDMHT